MFITNSGVQFLGVAVQCLPLFSTNISNHSVKIIGNSPKKNSCSSIYTYLCIYCSSLIRGFLFSFREKSCSFPSSHYEISFLVILQNIPSIIDSGSQQQNHLLEHMCSCNTLGFSFLDQKNPLDTIPFDIIEMQVKSHPMNLLGMQEPSFYSSEGMVLNFS
jgi:hypothetical protein